MSAAAGEDRWRTQRGQQQQTQQNRQQQQQQRSTPSHERAAGGASHQPQTSQNRQASGSQGMSAVSGNAWNGGDRANRGTPPSLGMAEDQHIPIRQFNAQETREVLKRAYVDAIGSESKPIIYKEPMPAGNAKPGGPWASKPNNMASGQDFFVQLRKQVTALQQDNGSKIDNSGDDTCVAIIQKHEAQGHSRGAEILFQKKVTADNSRFRGIHPLVALHSHQESLAELLQDALCSVPLSGNSSANKSDGLAPQRRNLDFITVTRGPGMRSNLSTGIDTAKAVAVSFHVPVVGVHHMQAHALTPRLVAAMENVSGTPKDPAFPFLSLLISGGHTLLLHSRGLTEHEILASTMDIALGDALDKIARVVLPRDMLEQSCKTSYSVMLEEFVFPNGFPDYQYAPPPTRKEEICTRPNKWGWVLGAPLAKSEGGHKAKAMEFSFSGLESSVRRLFDKRTGPTTVEERIELARESMRLAFEHLASRLVLALKTPESQSAPEPALTDTLVVAGGVASNKFLRFVLREYLNLKGFEHIRLLFPPSSLCTDNAAMIAWTGIEMYEAGWESDLSFKALRKWSMDPAADDGGILGVPYWERR
ncbi:MAG: hypothetical protein M1812_000064 [Candelaria pacifica]|nr:MAG: hypothetical protein M1812_000064 [Candelaria pacifica]